MEVFLQLSFPLLTYGLSLCQVDKHQPGQFTSYQSDTPTHYYYTIILPFLFIYNISYLYQYTI